MRSHRIHELAIDLLSLIALVAVGFVIDQQTELVSAVNEATGREIPALLLAAVFGGAVNLRREIRDWRERREFERMFPEEPEASDDE